MIHLESDRIQLRKFQLFDADDCFEYLKEAIYFQSFRHPIDGIGNMYSYYYQLI